MKMPPLIAEKFVVHEYQGTHYHFRIEGRRGAVLVYPRINRDFGRIQYKIGLKPTMSIQRISKCVRTPKTYHALCELACREFDVMKLLPQLSKGLATI